MSAGMEQLCQAMAEYLKNCGILAAVAFPAALRREKGPVAVVSLRGCQAESAGFQDYLGERFNEETGRWEELFGKKAKITFGLDLYAGEQGDGQQLQQAFDQLAGALILGGPDGLRVEEFSCGQTEYDGESRRLKRSVQAVCTVYLSAVGHSGGEFVDFELRGVVKA